MTGLIAYSIFAITTAICATIYLLHPCIKKRQSEATVEYAGLYYFSFFIVATMIAPLIFISCIVPEYTYQSQDSLYEGLFSKG